MSELSVVEKYEAAVAAHGNLISSIRYNVHNAFDDYGFLEGYERQGECHHCGEPDTGYCWCVDCDDECVEPVVTTEGRRKLKLHRREMRAWRIAAEGRLEHCIVLFRWELVRRAVRMRSVAFFWMGEAVQTAYAADGPGRRADQAAFAAELAAKLA